MLIVVPTCCPIEFTVGFAGAAAPVDPSESPSLSCGLEAETCCCGSIVLVGVVLIEDTLIESSLICTCRPNCLTT